MCFQSLIEVLSDKSLDAARKSRAIRKVVKICQDSYTAVEKCPKPVITAIHGHCVGAGLSSKEKKVIEMAHICNQTNE